jgi:hypothetical protein
MGFSVGSYAKIKEVENKGNHSKGKIVISKKIPNSNPAQYVCTFAGWVTLVGKAHKNQPMVNQKIKITNCDITNGYLDATGQQKFTNSPQYVIYDYELDGAPQNNGYMPSAYGAPNFANNSPTFEEISISNESDLPF